jgi:transcription elongation GreA/GreB family factor
MSSALVNKKEVFESLLAKKEREFKRLKDFQEDQLESINDSQELESHDIIENPNENQMREIRIENETLEQLQGEIEYLRGFTFEKERHAVEVGSLVKTNRGSFAVAVPQLNFKVKGAFFTAILAKSPLYKALEGKKEGDEVDFKNQKFKIEEVV